MPFLLWFYQIEWFCGGWGNCFIWRVWNSPSPTVRYDLKKIHWLINTRIWGIVQLCVQGFTGSFHCPQTSWTCEKNCFFLEPSLKPDQARMSVGCLTNFAEKDDPLQTKSCLESQNSKLEKCDSKTFIQQFPIKEESPTNNVVYYTLSKMFYQNVCTIMQLGRGCSKIIRGRGLVV